MLSKSESCRAAALWMPSKLTWITVDHGVHAIFAAAGVVNSARFSL